MEATEHMNSYFEVLRESRRLGILSWGEDFNFGSEKQGEVLPNSESTIQLCYYFEKINVKEK